MAAALVTVADWHMLNIAIRLTKCIIFVEDDVALQILVTAP